MDKKNAHRHGIGFFAIRILAALCTVLCLYLPLSAEAAWQPELKIGLQKGQTSLAITVKSPAQLVTADSKKPIASFKAGTTVIIQPNGQQLIVDDKKISAGSCFIQPADMKKAASLSFAVNGRTYRGQVEILNRSSSLTLVNSVGIEDYLYGVIPEEMPTEWPQEAVKSQAVAARTYALKHRKRHEDEGFDLCTSTHCQMYSGIAEETANGNKAVDATKGEVLTYQDKLIEAFFHTDSGGMTENSEDVWGTKLPYLRAVPEANMKTQPWQKTVTSYDFNRALVNHGLKDIGELKKVDLSSLQIGKAAKDRTASGRVKLVTFHGKNGNVAIDGTDLRSILGLNSTMFDLKLDSKHNLVFSGYGKGHGLGLSQWGAKALADNKKDYKGILAHYYQNTKLKKLY